MIHLLFPKSKKKSAIVNTPHSGPVGAMRHNDGHAKDQSFGSGNLYLFGFFKLTALAWDTNLFYTTGNLKLCVGVRS